MYRIFCESYENYINSFDKDNYRLEVSKPLELLVNVKRYQEEEKKQSEKFKKVCDLIYFMKENVTEFPKLKAFFMDLEFKEYEWKKIRYSKKRRIRGTN